MDMEDELDFDLETLRYVNIGRSRHSGVEAGLVVDVSRTMSAFVNYTLQDATSRAGEYSGNRLKAIPRHFATGGFSATVRDALEAGFAVSHARDSYLDDANTVELPAYTRVDARISYPVAGVRLFLDVGNVFDATYSTTGFPDPSGTDVIYFHPAAGRTFSLGLRGGF
jgi:outer membrane receptor protein involved in Fe transport